MPLSFYSRVKGSLRPVIHSIGNRPQVEAPQDMATPVVGDGLAVDAVSYAKTFGVPRVGPSVRLQLQQDLDAVSGELARGNDLAGCTWYMSQTCHLWSGSLTPCLRAAQKVASSTCRSLLVEVTHQQPLSELITAERRPGRNWTTGFRR